VTDPIPGAPAAPPPAPVADPGSPRAAQVALAVCIVLLVGLLAYRGYGNRLGARPTEAVAARVDLNRAERTDFEQIPGVGPKLAQAIVDHRGEKGRFQSVEQLRGVKGVGPATFDKVRPFLRVDPAPAQSPSDLDPPILERKKPAEAEKRPAPSRPANSRKLQPGDPPINVNTASFEQLLQLPDVGPATAQAIIAARTQKPFVTFNDLDRVKGIGPKKLEKLRPFVKVE
jgi:competence protein ComEA